MDPAQVRSPSSGELDETLAARRPRETLRPQTHASDLRRLAGRGVAAPTEGWEDCLPRLSLGATSSSEPGGPAGPDLEIRGTLGEGGMGRVLLVWQRSLGREVAVKTLKAQAAHEDARLMLFREGLIAGSLEHPGIVPVHALGISRNNEPLLVSKRIDGTSWLDLLRDAQHPMFGLLPGGRQDPLQAHLFILTQVCNAAHFAHSRGVIHRDIKPENVMVGGFGEVYLLDWGIAAQLPAGGELRTDDNELVGTPVYMAPEMVSAAAGPIDARTDVYLLGATLHEVLTGEPRHQGQNMAQVLQEALSSRPTSYGEGVPAELGELCRRATSRSRDDRPPSALAFRQAIETYLQHRGSEQVTAEAGERLAELRQRLRAPAAERGPVQRLSIECRFAFHMALRAWPESAAAQAGLRDCVTLLCEDALAQQRTSEARALLDELSSPPEELAARVREQEAARREAQAHEQSLRRLARDLDGRIGARARLVLAAVAICVDLGSRTFVTGFTHMPTMDQLLRIAAIITVLVTVAIYFGRRALLATAFSRRVLFAAMTMLWLHLLDRLLGKALGLTVPEVLRTDLFITTGVMLCMGATLHAAFYWLAALSLTALGASSLVPRSIGVIFPTTMLSMLVGGVLLHYKLDRPSPQTSRPHQ